MPAEAVEPVVELEIPASVEYVALARLVVSALASARCEVADDRIDDLKLAVSEACTNAIEAHGYSGIDTPISLRCAEDGERLEVVVQDRGTVSDSPLVPQPSELVDPDRAHFERSLGIPLIRTLVDEVGIHSTDAGTSVRMVLYCNSGEE